MKKNTTSFIAVLFLFIGNKAYAQNGRVGINTTTPATTLDIRGKLNTVGTAIDPTDVTGLQAPRLTRAELTAKGNTLYGINQKGALIYILDVTGGDANSTSPRKNINAVGYYYFDGTDWQKIGSGATNFWNTNGNSGTSNTNFIGTNDSKDLVFKTNNVESMRILSNGNIKINPNTWVEFTTSNTTSTYNFLNSNASGRVLTRFRALDGGDFDFRVYSTGYNETLFGQNMAGKALWLAFSDMVLGTAFAKNLIFGSNNLERMRLTGAGNLGIGTSTPEHRLDILTGDNTFGLRIFSNSAADNTRNGIRFGYNNNEPTGSYNLGKIEGLKLSGGGGSLLLNASPTATTYNSNQLVIHKNGNVGIGTTSPTSKLHNSGSYAGNIITINASTTLAEQEMIRCTGTTTFTITLPAANTCKGRKYILRNNNTQTLTISSYINATNTASTTIATNTLTTLVSDGANWIQF